MTTDPKGAGAGHGIASFEDLIDLANERLGGAAILCSDDFFAGMENLVKAKEAVWDEDAYTDRGKWMDGWESRRSHRENHRADASLDASFAHEDFCIVRLGAPGIIRGVVVDTAFFRGNYPSHCAIEALAVDGYPPAEEIAARADWLPVLDRVALEGNAKNAFAVSSSQRFTHVRLRIFPDGGVARLRVYGEPLPDWRLHGGLEETLDLASAELGGVVVGCSDMFFGSRHNLLFPGHSSGMHDGWETRRARRPGSDWAVIRLAARGHARRVVIDTSHFKGNCPESFALEGTESYEGDATRWIELHPRTALRPHTRHTFHEAVNGTLAVTHVRLHVFPDGGVARFRLFGVVDAAERGAQRARRLNAMPAAEAEATLRTACGSSAWVRAMLAARPYEGADGLARASDRAFASLSPEDWLEAFQAHPRIGGKKPVGEATTASAALSSREQASVGSADEGVKAALAEKNEAYFDKHGFIFIVKASGKSAAEMLSLLEARLGNDTETERANAAAEQRKITALRLERLA
jgi:allantoicase